MEIVKPIFIIGSGRSGTTILYDLLATHPDLCWFSYLTDGHPEMPQLALLHRLLDIPVVGGPLKRNIISGAVQRIPLRPTEAGNIYHHYCSFQYAKRTTENDLTEEMEDRFRKVIKDHLQYTGKPRFISKQTANTQRIRLIPKMFPDAYYVHMIRDGRAVANSLLNVKWWKETDIWWLGCRPPEWEAQGKEPIELCAEHWLRDVQEILKNKHVLGDRYLEVRYEELVEDVKTVVKRTTEFCELTSFEKFTKPLPSTLPNMNHKWKETLTESQKETLSSSLAGFLSELGYAT